MSSSKRRLEILELVDQINNEEFTGKCIKTDKIISTLDFIAYQMTSNELDELHELTIKIINRMALENE